MAKEEKCVAHPGAGKQLKLTQSDPGEQGWKSACFPPVAAHSQQGQRRNHSFLGELKGPHLPSSGSGSPLVTQDKPGGHFWRQCLWHLGSWQQKPYTGPASSWRSRRRHPKGQGGDKSGVSTVASLRTQLSHSPLSVLTALGEIYLPGSGAAAEAANSWIWRRGIDWSPGFAY